VSNLKSKPGTGSGYMAALDKIAKRQAASRKAAAKVAAKQAAR
jgi:hypothetical protein